MAAGPRLAMTFDLGFADARALIGRLGADAGLELVWVRGEDGVAARMDIVGLQEAIARRASRAAGAATPGWSWWRRSGRLPARRRTGPPVPEAGTSIGLSFGDAAQRHLAARLGAQETVAILLVDDEGRWVAQVDLRLGPDSRRLIGEAARRRAQG